MTGAYPRLILSAAAAAVVAALSLPAVAAEPTASEKLYADLAKLPADQRTAKILEGAKKEGKIEVLSANFGDVWRPNDMQWEKRYPEIKYNKTGLSSNIIAERIVTEETAGRHLTDVGVLSSVDTVQLVKRDMAAHYQTPVIDRIVPKYRGFIGQFPATTWTPVSMTTHVMAYNSKMLTGDHIPKQWFDLCKAEYKGQASYDPIEVRLLTAWYTMLGEEKAKELIQCIGATNPILGPNHTARFMMLDQGDHVVSGDILQNHVNKMQFDQPTKYSAKAVYTAPVLADAFGVVINKNAPSPYAAALYTDWQLSDDTQNHFVNIFYDSLVAPPKFTPPDAEMVLFGPIDQAIVDRLVGYWNQYVTKKDARGQQ
jgi:ABC-type Fe3+ transport system substrate-binding protein